MGRIREELENAGLGGWVELEYGWSILGAIWVRLEKSWKMQAWRSR